MKQFFYWLGQHVVSSTRKVLRNSGFGGVCLFISLLLIPQLSLASIWLGVAGNIRFEKDSDTSQLAARYPYGLLTGYRFSSSEIFAEYTTFSQTTGNPTLEIKRTNNLAFLGYRYYAFDVGEISWYPYFMGAVGGFWDNIETRLFQEVDEKVSKLNPVVAIGLGNWGTIITHWKLGSEFKVMYSRYLSPSVQLDLSLRTGFEF